ncbi:MAG: PAS domain S-box protein [Chloroflexota bacterium]
MWKLNQAKTRHWALDLLSVLTMLAPSERPRPAVLALRAVFLLGAVIAIDAVIAETGGLPSVYTNFYFIFLMYAGLSLPFPVALSITVVAIIGPSHRGSLFIDAVGDEGLAALSRPVSMGAMALFSWLVARVIRHNVSLYEQIYTSIAAHFPNGTISIFDSSLRYLVSGGEGLTQVGMTPDQITGKQPWDLVDADHLEVVLPAMQRAVAGEASAFELQFEGRDRLVRMTPIRDSSGRIVAGLSITQDITELRRAEAAVRESERRTFTFLESMPVAVFILDQSGIPYYSNLLATRLLGAGIVAGSNSENLSEVYHSFRAGTDEHYPDELSPIVQALDGKTTMIEDMELERPDGRMSIQVWGAPIRDESGKIAYALAAFSDITAQKRFEKALTDSEERFRTVFEDSPQGMAIVSPDSHFMQVNDAFCVMTGYGGDELVGRTFAEITHPDDRQLHAEQQIRLNSGELQVLGIEKRYIRKDGEIIWVKVSVSLVRNAEGKTIYSLATIMDITEQHRSQEQIKQLAYHDPLTALPNRRLMLDRIEQALAHTRRYGSPLALLSLDLDGFKLVNDQHGHAAGDAYLVETARRLEKAIRESDTVARMGGDEFLVLVTEASSADLAVIRDRIVRSLTAPFAYEGHALVAAPSIGVAIYGRDGTETDALLRAADAAMYADKKARQAEPVTPL